MSVVLRLIPRDPIVSRDGRPFGIDSGRRMRGLDWILPTAATGAVRTLVGQRLGAHYHEARFLERILRIGVRGPFPADGELFFPAPADVLVERTGRSHALRPLKLTAGEGMDLPSPLRPVDAPAGADVHKPLEPPAWWSADAMTEWLTSDRGAGGTFFDAPRRFLAASPLDERTHVSIDPQTLSAHPGLLFSTAGLALDDWRATNGAASVSLGMTLDVDPSDDPTADAATLAACHQLDELRPLGGERRLMRWTTTGTTDAAENMAWDCPQRVTDSLRRVGGSDGVGVRLVLATPGLFADGWRPGWIDKNSFEGSPPGCANVRLRLVGLANRRWQAVSGWSYEQGGPKRLRRIVPAGAVYFFEVVGSASDEVARSLSRSWLRSTSDSPADRREGWGLGLWGVWRATRDD